MDAPPPPPPPATAPSQLLADVTAGVRLADLGLCAAADPAAAARLASVADDVGLSARFAVAGAAGEVAVTVEIAPRASSRPSVAQTASFSLSYRARPGLDPAVGAALCAAVARAVAGREGAFLQALAAAQAEAGGDDEGRGLRHRRGGPLLVRVDTASGSFDALAPYTGCSIGCGFCYASERAGAWWQLRTGTAAPWGSWVEARVDAAEVLRRELRGRPRLPIKLTPIASDPWLGVERKLRLTRACLAVLAEAAPPVDVIALTRSRHVLDDLDGLAAIAGMRVGVSLPTVDDAVRARFEPRAASVAERLHVLAALRARGVRTFAVVQPMLPGPLDALADAVAAHAGSASLDVLHGVYGAGAAFAGAYAEAAGDAWQQARLQATAAALQARGVDVWAGELPPELGGWGAGMRP